MPSKVCRRTALFLALMVMAVLLTGCGGGGADESTPTPVPRATENSNPSASSSGGTANLGISGTWDQARFGILPEPKNAIFPLFNINNDPSMEYTGLGISSAALDQYVIDLVSAGFFITEDSVSGNQREIRAHKDGNKVVIYYNVSGESATLSYYPFRVNTNEMWPKGYLANAPVPNAELFNVEDQGDGGYYMGIGFAAMDDLKDFIARCEAAGYSLAEGYSDPDYDSEDIYWTGVGKDGSSIEMYIRNYADDAIVSGEILLKK